MNDYYMASIEEVRRLMQATDVKYDLTGITVTINDSEMFLPVLAIRAMAQLLYQAEDEALSKLRSELEADRAGASPS